MADISPLRLSLSSLTATDRRTQQNVLNVIEKAYGPGGPGLLLITELRDTFSHERQQLLSGARALANLEAHTLNKLEFPDLHFSVGWSRGKESFKGVRDFKKGSFYANPVHDCPSRGDRQLEAQYPHDMHVNQWPEEQSCSMLEPNFKSIGRYINQVGILLGSHCDRYIRMRLGDGAEFMGIEETLKRSRAAKGRLLYYFPMDGRDDRDEQKSTSAMWCGYHNDHGTLTGLISGAYFEVDRANPLPAADVADSTAGLHVARGEGDAPQKVVFPEDCLAFQIGESAQIASGGILRATPHAVRSLSNRPDVSRATLAVFMQPNPWEVLKPPYASCKDEQGWLYTNRLVPPLSDRYHKDDSFHDFASRTVQAYYR